MTDKDTLNNTKDSEEDTSKSSNTKKKFVKPEYQRPWFYPELTDEQRENLRQNIMEQEARYRRMSSQSRTEIEQYYLGKGPSKSTTKK